MPKTLSVAAIKEGTVIDHILAGFALMIIQLLKLSREKYTISIGLNLSSSSMGLKDLIKIENRYLNEKEMRDIALFAPQATISIIKNYRVSSKTSAQLPEVVSGILLCPNLHCITNSETVDTLFHLEKYKQQVLLHCHYCEKIFERNEIKKFRTSG